MSCRTRIQGLEKDSCRALKLQSHDAEVSIDDCLQVKDVLSRPVSVLKRFLEDTRGSTGFQSVWVLYLLKDTKLVIFWVKCFSGSCRSRVPVHHHQKAGAASKNSAVPVSWSVEPVLCSYTWPPASVSTSLISVDSEASRRSMAISADYYTQDPPKRMTTALRRWPVHTFHWTRCSYFYCLLHVVSNFVRHQLH